MRQAPGHEMEITRKLLVLVQTASSVAARLKAAPDSAAGCASLVQLGVSSASNETPPYLNHNGGGSGPVYSAGNDG